MATIDVSSNAQDNIHQADGLNEKPSVNAAPAPNGDAKAPEKNEQDNQKKESEADDKAQDKKPAGGYDSIPIPKPPPGVVGYTLKFTFHSASDLAMGDAHVMSSDPYILAQLNTDLPQRHKEDPPLRFRSRTVRRSTNPTWSEEWTVANVPSSGFKLKVRVFDEDPADHDDQLGKVHVTIPSLNDSWAGIKNQSYKLTIRDASKRAQAIRAFATCFRFVKHLRGDLTLSIEMIGRTGEDHQNGRPYTLGECRWVRHYSALLGRLANIKEPDQQTPEQQQQAAAGGEHQKQVQHYNFQANQIQLQGPVPPELYHRFVEFKPWVKRMFTTTGFQGAILGHALHHQHERVYNFGKSTVWGNFPQGACKEMTQQFLDLVHYDQGGRIFTYVLTLDALWRFTETGKEFGIDMLSKHTMHSDVSIYIAFSGEFFIRRLKHPRRPPPPHPTEATSQQQPPEHAPNEEHPPHDLGNGPPDADPPTDPSHYELVIDNDSGTYRPNAKMLPILAQFLSQALPGLHIQTLDCQADEKKMSKMKNEQRERKKREGQNVVYAQGEGDDNSSLSSSDDERLDERQAAVQAQHHGDVSTGPGGAREHGALQAAARDAKMHQQSKWDKAKRSYGPHGRDDGDEVGGEGGAQAAPSS